MANTELPTIEELRKLIACDAIAGVLTWKPRHPDSISSDRASTRQRICRNLNARCEGRPALNTITVRGYFAGSIMMKMLYAHRAIWAIHYGAWPDGEVDHIDGDKLNNRLSNLRVVTSSENSMNTKIYSNNKTGHHGVWWDKTRGNYQVHIRRNGKRIVLGRFALLDEAVSARKDAEIKLGFHPNHGRI